MDIINISKKKFENLEKYELPNTIFNTEATMYTLPIKNRWAVENKLLKKLFITNGQRFGNKLQTINSLIDSKKIIGIDEIVFPEKLAVVDNKVVGYTMELIDSINLDTVLKSPKVPAEKKIKYLRQIGELLEKMKNTRRFTKIKDFYLNDMHENNFIIEKSTDSVKAVDIDSCKINGNYTFGSRYLTPMSLISKISKYEKEDNGICGGYIKPTEDTDMYCYIIIILSTLLGFPAYKLTFEEFYDYMEYLSSIGVDKELINMFEKILQNTHNENPYELLDSLKYVLPQANNNVYTHVRKK